jgi:hypothetical protein
MLVVAEIAAALGLTVADAGTLTVAAPHPATKPTRAVPMSKRIEVIVGSLPVAGESALVVKVCAMSACS